jgi:hypothetical protein
MARDARAKGIGLKLNIKQLKTLKALAIRKDMAVLNLYRELKALDNTLYQYYAMPLERICVQARAYTIKDILKI